MVITLGNEELEVIKSLAVQFPEDEALESIVMKAKAASDPGEAVANIVEGLTVEEKSLLAFISPVLTKDASEEIASSYMKREGASEHYIGLFLESVMIAISNGNVPE